MIPELPEHQILAFGNLRISSEQVVEMQDNRPVLAVKRQDIRSISLRHGYLARHPFMQMVFATALTICSGTFLLGVISTAMNGLIMFWPFLSGIFTVLGLWLLYDALRRGHFVEVWTG